MLTRPLSDSKRYDEPCNDLSDQADLPNPEITGHATEWTEVVRQRSKNRREMSPRDTFHETVVAAVYMDQSIKKQRENSLIVSGFDPKTAVTDREQFISLCVKEFQLEPQIVSVKRLGRSQMGRIQPLLVHLKQVDQAKQLISS